MFIRSAFFAALITGLFASASQAQNCAPRDFVLDRLASKYGETRRSIGLGGNNVVIELFASDETGTWTITATSPRGVTCLIASGQSYEGESEAASSNDNDA